MLFGWPLILKKIVWTRPPVDDSKSAESKHEEEGHGRPDGHQPESRQRVGCGLRDRRAGIGESARPGGKGAHDSSHCVVTTLVSSSLQSKLVNGSGVGQVGPVDSSGQVGDLDPSLVNSSNLSRVGQVRPVDSCRQVGYLDPSLVNSCNLSRVGQVRPVD